MAELTEELRVLVTAEVDKAIKNLKDIDTQTAKTQASFEKLGKIIGTAFITKAVVDFGKTSVAASEDARKTFQLLKSTIDVTGASAWTSIDAMTAMSEKLSDATNYSAGEIQSMQTVLLGFKNITGDTFEETANAILDMAAVMGMDLTSAAQAVGKALDDPVNGMDSLSRQGFKFSDSQKDMLKNMVATGKQAEAQKIILDELNTTYGNAAKAAQTSFARLEHQMDTLKETVGDMLTPALADIAENVVGLVEKFDSLDAGTQRAIVTSAALVAATPAVITAIGGVKTALVALGASTPQLLALTAAITAVSVVATKISNSRNAFKDLQNEITKTRSSSNALLDSFAAGNDEKKLDEKTTQELIRLYPELAGKIDAYSTSVDDARKAVENLVNQKILDSKLPMIKRYQERLEEIAKVEEKMSKLDPANAMDKSALQGYTAQIEAQVELAEKQRAVINENLKSLGKMMTYDGTIISLPVEIDKDSLKEGLTQPDSDTKKTWQDWLSSILGVDKSLFTTGKQAADLYIQGLTDELTASEELSKALGEPFSKTEYLDSQLESLKKKIQEALSIDPSQINEAFSIEELSNADTALGRLVVQYKELKAAKDGAFVSDEIKRMEAEVDNLTKSERELYIIRLKNAGATEEEIEYALWLLDVLNANANAADSLGDHTQSLSEKIGAWVENSLNELDLLDEKSNKVIGNLASSLSDISFDAVLDGFEAFGEALGEGEDAAESLQAALAAMAQSILDQLPTLFLQAGLLLIAQNQWPLGLGFIAAAGSSAIVSGYVSGKTSSSSTEENALGGVYGDSAYKAFAKGDTFTNAIVTSPTFFKFAKGSGFGTGLMGEAGPEAVMPLTRGADGSLGVDASGLSGGDYSLTVIVNNYGSEEVTTEETTDEETGSRTLEITIGAVINSHIANGKADKALKNRYGLKVQGV